MKTEKLFVLAIFSVLHCILSTITQPQYEVEVMISGFINQLQQRPYSCNDLGQCLYTCCDGFNSTSRLCHRCDSFFTYCLRDVGTRTVGCPEGGNTMTSDTNPNDTSIDFSQNTVLGLDNPLVFPGLNGTWNGVQLYVRIFDQDLDGSELIDVVRWNIIQPVGVPSGKIRLRGLFGMVMMEVNIIVFCVPGFTGCNCSSGFIGVLCNETSSNMCVNETCSGRGRCVDSYVCDCDAGFTGENCEINIDDCLMNTCGEGGQCVDGVESFICVCNPGFTGKLCQTNIDDCVGVNCSGNGECVDKVNTFTCDCSPGFIGPLCAEVPFLRGNDSGPIVGGVLGVFVAIILILILVIVVVLIIRGRKRPGKDVQEGQPSHGHSGALPGDNPVYELMINEEITSTTSRNPTANIMLWDTSQPSNGGRSGSAPGREFDNPIYGNQDRENVYSVPDLDTSQIGTGSTSDHKFDNPIYGDETTHS